jgi:naphtho-gamma-pyrone polyketide synthase
MSPRASNVFNSIINIVVQEVGISLSEVQPDSLFADLGIDSLLSLTVTSRINDELGMNLSPSLFAEYPTIRDLQSFITPTSTDGATTPALVPDSETDEDDHPAELTTTDSVIDVEAIVRQTISEQIGIPATSIPPGTCMAELGVDSLLGLTIADALSESLGQPISCNLLAANDTLDQIEAAVRKSLGLSTILPLSQPLASNIRPSAKVAVTHEMGSCSPAATSVMLQRPKHGQSPRQTLFLFPDGSGSAASYAFLPRLDPSIAVCGLNCPWRTTPEDMVREAPDMSQLVAKYIFEIRKIQPTGPYQLGGWSAGGICAFEAARQLLEAGEAVNKLILLDSPNPIGLENPPARMYDFFETLGLFGSGGADSSVPQWLRAHFDAFIGLLDRYEPCTLPNAPPTVMIYARDGICKDPSTPRPTIRDDDPREMLWLLNNRTDFSAEGWVSLVGQEKIKVHVLDNVNHFSMMDAGPSMELMGEYIRRAMKEAL